MHDNAGNNASKISNGIHNNLSGKEPPPDGVLICRLCRN